jgi:hypothetical protein
MTYSHNVGFGMETSPFASMMPDRPPTEDVRYPQNSGKHLLVLSFSHFDPTRTLGEIKKRRRSAA